ncbi:MAG: hypothetical protein R3F42_05155 [Pseudomonadota bacterium]
MSNHHEALARQVVEQFTQALGPAVRAQIAPAHLADLEQAIRTLLAHEHDHIADLLEALARSLRSGADKAALEL